ncbi:hypothetical protein K501DRAFT_289213, partial [Backusella circina FSU 941]
MEKTAAAQQEGFRTPPREVFRTPSSRADRITKSLPPSGSRYRYTPLGTSITESTSFRRQRPPQFTSTSTSFETARTPLSRSTTFCSDAGDETTNIRWTRLEWKKLEQYYVKNDRDYKRAGESFYMNESLQRVDGSKLEEKWTKDHCIWRSQCFDTNVNYNKGLLPSERKKKKQKNQLEQRHKQQHQHNVPETRND